MRIAHHSGDLLGSQAGASRDHQKVVGQATAAGEETLEAELYAVRERRLPDTTIMSIGHRSAVVGLHRRHIEMAPEGDHFTLRDASKAAAE